MEILLTLAILKRNTGLIVVLKEGVQPGTVYEDVFRIKNTKTPSFVVFGCSIEDGICICDVGSEWSRSIRVTLVIWRLGLDEGHVDILCLGNLVIVKNVVLGGCSPKPNRAFFRGDQDTSAIVKVDLSEVAKIKFVIGNPEPTVLYID